MKSGRVAHRPALQLARRNWARAAAHRTARFAGEKSVSIDRDWWKADCLPEAEDCPLCSSPPDESGAICLVQAIGHTQWLGVGHIGERDRGGSGRDHQDFYYHPSLRSIIIVLSVLLLVWSQDWSAIGLSMSAPDACMHIQSVYDHGIGQRWTGIGSASVILRFD